MIRILCTYSLSKHSLPVAALTVLEMTITSLFPSASKIHRSSLLIIQLQVFLGYQNYMKTFQSPCTISIIWFSCSYLSALDLALPQLGHTRARFLQRGNYSLKELLSTPCGLRMSILDTIQLLPKSAANVMMLCMIDHSWDLEFFVC